MKNKYFFSLALAALMLGACSDDNGLNDKEQGPVLPGEKGYVCLSINLPTQKGGRANDVFSDGEAVEYNVNDATLLIFSGSSESEAVFSGAYDLKHNFAKEDPDNNNITTSSKITQAITKPTGNNVYALVVLNKDGLLRESGGTWSYGSNSFSGSTKFSDFATSVHELNVSTIASTSNGGNFLMLNAPLFSKPGAGIDPQGGNLSTLAVIDKTKIYSTQSEAMTNPAADIYVERAVAKVTVKQGTPLTSGDGDKLVSATLEGWVLDITNKKTYPVRNIETTNPWWSYTSSYLSSGKDYRFVGSVAVATDVYRTYWGKDPNYDGQGYTDSNHGVNVTTEFNDLSNTTPSSLLDMGTNAYCLENTFDVENMRKDQTTRVIVAAKLVVDGADDTDGSFYTLNDDKGMIYKKDAIVSKIKQEYLDNPTINALLHDPTTGLKGGSTLGESYIKVEFAKGTASAEDIGNLEGGTITVKSIYIDGSAASLFNGGSVPAGLNSDNATVTASLNASNKISYYKNGVAYYPVQIKHFGNRQTPWNDNNDFTDSYPDNNGKRTADFLGRYGVLRNNWYEIEVTSVKKIGSAEVEPETGYDDPIASWIGVNINILSWAKRTQQVAL